MRRLLPFICLGLAGILPFKGKAQALRDTISGGVSLQQCVQYAITHQPLVQQALIDQRIIETTIKSKLADWYPQVNLNANLQDNFQLPAILFNGQKIYTTTYGTSTAAIGVTQNIFDRDVLLASHTANDVRTEIRQVTEADKINITVAVSQAFYLVLLNLKQIDLTTEDIVRLQRSLKDAYSQYQAGIVDKIDYKRATISLNNSIAQKKGQEDSLKAKYSVLKLSMGYPDSAQLQLQFDSAQLQKEIFIDTTGPINYNNRIEYKLLQTQSKLLQENIKYNKLAYFPTISAFGSYDFNFYNNSFSKLYNQNYPTSYVGLQLSLPIFQGFKRGENIRGAELQFQRNLSTINGFKDTINTQYQQALAAYKSNLENYTILDENLRLATDVYNTLEVQYKAGIKTYLDVITGETDLRSAEISYANALYQVLISKVSVQKALGIVQY